MTTKVINGCSKFNCSRTQESRLCKCPPEINPHLTNQSLPYNSSLQFDCFLRGFPVPEVLWTKDGVNIGNNNTFTIRQARLEDSGQYACSATNSLGNKTSTLWIEVIGVSPQITESPINQTVTEGYSVNFSCRASGIPTPTLAWVFNNSDLPSGSNKTDQEVESILELTRVTKEMKGTYKCTATNKESSTSSSATLIVYGKASAQVVSESHQTLTTGDVFALTCKVNEETINIAWKKDGESLKERAVIDTRLHARKSKLVITEVVEEDSGEYSCEASNKAGTVAHSSVILDVEAAPSSSPLEWYYIVGPVAAVIFLFALIVHTEKCRAAALQEDAGPDERGAAAAIPNSEGGEPGATVYPFVTEVDINYLPSSLVMDNNGFGTLARPLVTDEENPYCSTCSLAI
ncbi:hemicentin-2-like [Stylophora pistillata]|uniref:hemicentin-2-like n=1 Tax=Stylophora pistillata TaxID=50429 RepID=UPI000C03CD58|nr:hemicentin-2-like [Stylophora pistillata]